MECGKLTAKLRDAVPVCFMENGKEVMRYKNIEIPDEIKKLECIDFKFDVPANGAITFKIHFEPGILPDEWPQARQRKTRSKSTEPAAHDTIPNVAEVNADEIEQVVANGDESPTEPIEAEDDDNEQEVLPETMEVRFNVTGNERKALAHAIAEQVGGYPAYQAAPSFEYTIGEYTLDRNGILTGPYNAYLLGVLAEDGYQTK